MSDILAFGDENELAHKIRDAIGVGDFDEVEVLLPQFERTDGKTIYYFPATVAEFDKLKEAPDWILKEMGLQQWEEGHWLYPDEWYDYIPDGYSVLTISGKTKTFQKGKSNNDIRCGALPYGFRKNPGGKDG